MRPGARSHSPFRRENTTVDVSRHPSARASIGLMPDSSTNFRDDGDALPRPRAIGPATGARSIPQRRFTALWFLGYKGPRPAGVCVEFERCCRYRPTEDY
jgi:hypothetical protein